jgi:hypothetical protein
MTAGLQARVQRLEHRAGPTTACVLAVDASPEDLAAGRDVFDVALKPGGIPAEVLRGQRMLLLLPSKCTDIDLWCAKGKSLAEWQAAPPGQRPGVRDVAEAAFMPAKRDGLQLTWPPAVGDSPAPGAPTPPQPGPENPGDGCPSRALSIPEPSQTDTD